MTAVPSLSEYGQCEIAASPAQIAHVQRLARKRITIVPSTRAGHFVVTATSHVGTIAVPGLRLLIQPKVRVSNLFYLLEAGGDALSLGTEIFDYERTGDLVPSFATFYARVLQRSLARGLPRRYREEEDLLVPLRGRISVTAQIRRAGVHVPTACRFDEYTADTQLNRLLLAATERLTQLSGVTSATKQALFGCVVRFEGVGRLTPADLSVPLRFTRLDEHFEPAARLAAMVLRSTSLQAEAGSSGAGVFLIDMNCVFEEFVETRLRRYLKGRLHVEGQATSALDVRAAVPIRPDLLFREAGRIVYVGDSKYKVSENGFARQSDYYQLLAYATALNVDEGVLVYCLADGPTPEREVVVRHAGKRLWCHAIPLSGSPSDIEAELRHLADWIVGRLALTSAAAGSLTSR